MAISHCTSCGLTIQNCQCRRRASTTVSGGANYGDLPPAEITPACWSSCYSCWTICFVLVFLLPAGKLFNLKAGCYLELFADSVSVSNSNVNANISTADWSIGLVAMSPVSGCKISLHAIKSRLLRGDEVVSESSPSLDGFGQLVTSDETDDSVITVGFKGVAMAPGVVVGDVVKDYRVEIATGVKADSGHGFLMVLCGDFPVKYMVDPVGNVIGSLLGNMKRCDYLFRDSLDISV